VACIYVNPVGSVFERAYCDLLLCVLSSFNQSENLESICCIESIHFISIA
jgi:hypothetical protein